MKTLHLNKKSFWDHLLLVERRTLSCQWRSDLARKEKQHLLREKNHCKWTGSDSEKRFVH